MHTIKFVSARCENFKGFKQFSVQFGDKITKISGVNGVGKSTIASLIMWVLFGVDYDLTNNPKVRREVNGIPVNDVPVLGELVMTVDGTEVTARKIQKRSIKDDGSYADANSYSINEVDKTLRDFQAYFNFNFDDLMMCMNIGSFLAKKPTEMREFLFKLPEDISDKDIISRFPEFEPLVPLTEKYTIEEISAMNKSSITKLNKEIAGYPGRIDEVNRQLIEDVDISELELQINALKEQIAEVEKQEDDSLSHVQEFESMSNNIMDLKSKKSDLERAANTALFEKKSAISKRIDEATLSVNEIALNQKMANMDKDRIERVIASKKKEKADLLEKWKSLNKSTYPEYVPLQSLSADNLTCPTCGQDLPDDVKAKKISEFEETSKNHAADYASKKTSWELKKKTDMDEIAKNGQKLQKEVAELESVKLPALNKSIQELAKKEKEAKALKATAQEELDTLPVQIDLSDNQEYEGLCAEISKKEEALKSINTGSDYRATIKAKKVELQDELDSVKTKISKVSHNAELEYRIEFLRSEQAQKEQAKADCEKILSLLDSLDQKKNDLLTDVINGHFWKVKWQLFSFAKNGNYKKDYCEAMIDGFSLKDAANKGRVIEAKIDIATSIQKIVGLDCPIILDDAESLDDDNLSRIFADVQCQSVILVVDNNKKLNVEVF